MLHDTARTYTRNYLHVDSLRTRACLKQRTFDRREAVIDARLSVGCNAAEMGEAVAGTAHT